MILKFDVKLRLILVFSLASLVVTGAMAYYSSITMRDKMIVSAEEKLKADLRLGGQYLNKSYPGEWELREGRLYKGNTLMEGNYYIVDKIGSLTGDTVTIFNKDTRVATNVMKQGKRAVGTTAAPEVIDKVLKKGKIYLGEADVAGIRNITAYRPVKNNNNEIIGMWYVGVPATVYEDAATKFSHNMILFALLAVLLAIIASWYVASTVSAPLKSMETVMARASEGDFTREVNIKHNDEIGRLAASLNLMMDKISKLIGQTRNLSGSVYDASQNLTKGMNESTEVMQGLNQKTRELSHAASEQAKATGDTRVVIVDMSAGIQQVAVNSQEVAMVSETTMSTAEQGEVQIEQAVKQMMVINDAVGTTAQIVRTLGVKSSEIGQIVDVITAIAGQTNLLALNAAIEAARAGEQGRGFAVVAEEVRKLAEESQLAAGQIAARITDIQNETERAVEAMERGIAEVTGGAEVVTRAGEAFGRIISAVKDMSRRIQEVSAAGQEMTSCTESAILSIKMTAQSATDTMKASQEISQLTEKQMAGLREVDDSANYLQKMAHDLDTIVSQFKIAEGSETL
ncbi:MAG: methyl-accepting chemotaxis protein [Chitinophagales bacterium]